MNNEMLEFKSSAFPSLLEIENAVNHLLSEKELDDQIRRLMPSVFPRIIRIPFELTIKHDIASALVEKPDAILPVITRAIHRRIRETSPLESEPVDVIVDIVPFEGLEKQLGKLTAERLDKLVFLRGRVTAISKPRPKVTKKLAECDCGAQLMLATDPAPSKCPRCGSKPKRIHLFFETVQNLQIGDARVEVRSPLAPLQLSLGDWVRVTGILRVRGRGFLVEAIGLELLGKKEAPPEVLFLEHITEIENPALVNRRVRCMCVVSSNSVAYYVPKVIETSAGDFEIDATDTIQLKLINVSDEARRARLQSLLANASILGEKEHRILYLMRVRPPVFALEERGGRILDERGREYRYYDIYVVSDQKLSIPPSTTVILEGIVLPDPRTQKATMLAYRVEPVGVESTVNLEKLRKLKKKLDEFKTVGEKVRWLLDNWARYSGIVGRDNVALAYFLAYFSPIYLTLGRDRERGWAIVTVIGDTTTGKSKTGRKMIALLEAGMMIEGELASVPGLVGAATQAPGGSWFVDFGFLVLNDMKLLMIDGAHKLAPQLWAQLAEAERKGIVTIAKAGKETAYARTRQVRICNPVDYTGRTTSVDNFFFAVESLRSVFDDVSIARTDLAVFTRADDVKIEDVNRNNLEEPEPEFYLLSELLKWAWAEKHAIEWADDAYRLLLSEAARLYNEFHSDRIPLVSIDMKYKLARLAIALARLTLSVDENFRRVLVTPEHVAYISSFIADEYERVGLRQLALVEKRERLTEEDAQQIFQNLAEKLAPAGLDPQNLRTILEFIAQKGHVTRGELLEKFSLPEKNVLRPLLDILKGEELIKMGKGFYPTPRLIQLTKLLVTLPNLPNLPTQEEYPPSHENIPSGDEAFSVGRGDTPSRLVSLASLVTELRLICSHCLEDVRKTSFFVEVVSKHSDLGDCEFCAERRAEYVIRVRSLDGGGGA